MIHYFNPGHETAVLSGSPFYQATANQRKIQEDLAYLPAWYAGPNDFVLTGESSTDEFRDSIASLNPMAQAITFQNRNTGEWEHGITELWGISPAAIHTLKKQSQQHQFQWDIPIWKDDYRSLGSRHTAQECLRFLMDMIPEIDTNLLPVFFSDILELENYLVQQTEKQVVKAPFSSSGRGLFWLSPTPLLQSEKQIIRGILKKQSAVSIEKALEKQLDFSLHFTIHPEQTVDFSGYSVFRTNGKGAYEHSLLASQEVLQQQIHSLIDEKLLSKVKKQLQIFIQKKYAPIYQGTLGVDLLIYRSGDSFHLHPCVEINMRKSMGYLAIQLANRHLCAGSQGAFFVSYDPHPGAIYLKHKEMHNQYPLIVHNKCIRSGYLALCPVRPESRYWAYLLCSH
ncbi:MAG: hypothetical protein LBN18_07775 [Dysgonamonadaceae bacterium]|jgi:hypothetical protein|nr:hypothetical protein [Dysgonamonadaceae bacterium]